MHRLTRPRLLLACIAVALAALAVLAPTRAQAQVRYASKASFGSFVAGVRFTCARAETGQTFCWGHDEYGQVGAGTLRMECTRDRYANGPCARGPVEVRGQHRFVALGAGDEHACGIDGAGSVWCWGRGKFGARDRWGQPERCALEMDGMVLHVPCARTPARLPRGAMAGAIAVDGGEDITCAVDERGAAWCWDNTYPERQQRIPLDRRAITVAAGGQMACVLTDQRGVRCWNMRDLQRVGVTTPTPDTGFASVVVGTAHACALDAQGAATCWGRDRDAALGVGRNKHGRFDEVPAARVLGDHRFTQLVAGSMRTCGIDRDEALWCWGRVPESAGANDQCYDSNWIWPGTNACTNHPVRVHPGLRFTALAIGGRHQCGLTKERGSVCWGRGEVGQLGNGSLLASDDAIPIRTDGVPPDLAFRLDVSDTFETMKDHRGLALLAVVGALGLFLLVRASMQWWSAADAYRPAATERRASAAWDDGSGRNRGLVVVVAGWALLLLTVLSSAGGGPYDEVSGGAAAMGFLLAGTVTLVLSLVGGGLALVRLRIHRDDGRARLAVGLASGTVALAVSLAAWATWGV